MWFPLVNRAGMHNERPDSNWFLEQWIPFDASNQSIEMMIIFQTDVMVIGQVLLRIGLFITPIFMIGDKEVIVIDI